VNESADEAEYELTLTGDGIEGEMVLIGKNVDSNWDPDTGFIFLNTDENNEPLGTLTMNLAVPLPDAPIWLERWGYVPVYDALASKSDVRVGTAAETNSRTYTKIDGDDKGMTEMKIGNNFIWAKVDFKMERVLAWPSDAPETVTLKGTFTAVD